MPTYDPRQVLEALLEEKRELDSAISYFRRVIARSAARAPLPKNTTQETDKSEKKPKPSGPYAGMTNPDAAVAYLKSVDEAKTPKEIEKALLAGGLETSAEKFYSTLYTTLLRLEESGKIRKTDDGKWVASQPSESSNSVGEREASR